MTAEDSISKLHTSVSSHVQPVLLDMLDGPAGILSPVGELQQLNQALEELLKVPAGEAVGRNIAEFLHAGQSKLAELLTGSEFGQISVVVAARDGSVDLDLKPVTDDKKAIVGWVVRFVVEGQLSATGASPIGSLDPLTSLPDRDFIRARLNALINNQASGNVNVTVMCVDLDGFDSVNRDYGRAAGDAVLIETADRLGRSMRASNIVGRLVEDAFLVVIPDMRSEEQIASVATRLISHLSRPFVIKGVREPIILSASVGISDSDTDSTVGDAATLIGNAQTAVDLAKKTGLGTFQFFTNATGGEIRERRSRVSNLRRAIDQGEFDLVYQPKLSLATNKVVGAEALVRWQHPESGTIMPDQFIPLAEDAGLIDPLGNQILSTACELLRKWHDRQIDTVRIAVNVSAREVARKSFYDDLVATITSAGISPEMLELELTESAIMEGAEEIVQSLHMIRELGVHLTADDFGTGYSSLSYLKNFPLDGLKIDTTFVADIENPDEGGGLAAAVIAVGHSLGMNVVAEGVETQHQLNYLRWRECDQVQGFLISEPLEADAFEQMIREQDLNDDC